VGPDQVADDAALRWLLGRGLLQPAGADALRRAAVLPGSPGLLALAAPRLRPEDAAELARVRAGALERARAGRPDPSDSDLTLRLAPGSAAGAALTAEDPTLRLAAPASSGAGADDVTMNVPPPAQLRSSGAQPGSSGSQAALARTLAAGPPTHTGKLTNSLTLSNDAGGLRRIGPYEVVRELARGGMGAVLVARRPGLDRQVALKVMLSGDAAGQEEVERFLTEARVAARLKHPNIVGILDVGADGTRPYLVMDLIDGESLKAKLGRGPLDPREAAELCRDVAKALAYAHGQAVLHRDIKPHNILVTKDGTPVVTDFGLAKDVGEGVAKGQTKTGQVMGTPAYMPPEQAEGHTELVDRRADVYSLGATLYEALVGEAPFQGATPLNIITQVLSKDPVPPRKRRPDVDRDLDTIVLRCLEKEPERRYQTAAALAEDLDRWLSDEPITARPATVLDRLLKWRRRNRAVAAVLMLASAALALGGVASLFAFLRADREARQAQAQETVAGARRTYDERGATPDHPGAEEAATLAPDDLQRRFEEPIAWSLGALAAAERWQTIAVLTSLSPTEATEAVKREAESLVSLAVLAQQWSVAAHGVRRLSTIDESVARAARARVDHAREELLTAKIARPFELAASGRLADKALGLVNAAARIAESADDQTVVRVAAQLDAVSDRLARWLRGELAASVPAEERQALEGALDAWLGELGGGDAPPPLITGKPRSLRTLSPEQSRVIKAGVQALLKAEARARQTLPMESAGSSLRMGEVLSERLGDRDSQVVQLACLVFERLGVSAVAQEALDRYLRCEPRLELCTAAMRAVAVVLDRSHLAPGAISDAFHARPAEPGHALDVAADILLKAGLSAEDVASLTEKVNPSLRAPVRGGEVVVMDPSVVKLSRNELMTREELARAIGWLDAQLPAAAEAEQPQYHYLRSEARLRSGDAVGALSDIEVGLAKRPTDFRFRFARANARVGAKDFEGALADLDECLANNPQMAVARLLRAQLHLDAGRLGPAEEDAEVAVRVRPDFARSWYMRGMVRCRQDRLAEGFEDVERALAMKPGEADFWCGRGQARHLLGSLAGAEADYSKALELDPGHRVARIQRATVRKDLGHPREGLADAEAALEQGAADPWVLAKAAEVLAAAGQVDRAMALLDRSLELQPAADLLTTRGRIRGSLGDDARALEDLERAAKLGPEEKTQNLVSRAMVLFRLRRTDEARRAFEAAIARAPRDAEVLYNFAFFQAASGAAEAAEVTLTRYLEARRDDPQALLMRAALRLRRSEEAARSDLERVVEVAPGEAPMVEALRRLAAGDPVACLELAEGTKEPKDLALAAREVRVWLSAHPTHPRAAAGMAKLEALRPR
jgi:tetratricopeptide (TPR) repeat protein